MEMFFEKAAIKHISEKDAVTRNRLLRAIQNLPAGDIKKLRGRRNDYRLRVGDFRVIFSISDSSIIISDVLPRGEAYKH